MFRIQKKELDLLAAYNRKEGTSASSYILRYVSIPVGILVVFLGVFLFLYIGNHNIQGKIDDVNLLNEEIQLKIDATDHEPYNELTTLQGTYQSLEEIDNYIASLPIITQKQIMNLKNSLLGGMTMNSLGFTQETGQISVTYSSSNVQNIEKYISNLKTKYNMANISYNGYQQSTSSSTTSTGEVDPLTGQEITTTVQNTTYSFSLVITANGGA